MNHRGGWALIKRSWASWLQYRSFFFVLAFGWMIPPLIYLFVWSTASRAGADRGHDSAAVRGVLPGADPRQSTDATRRPTGRWAM